MRFRLIYPALCVLALASVAHACPMCKDSIATAGDAPPGTLSAGFNLSIYAMLGGALAMLAFVCRVIYKGVRDSN
jgi:hypothetical protein